MTVRLEPLRLVQPVIGLHIRTALAHRPAGPEDFCTACGLHHPCPAYFGARLALIRAGVHPRLWAR